MPTIPIFPGKVEKDKLILDNPLQFHTWKRSFEGKRIELILRQQKAQRSLNQNSYYWSVIVPMICEELGYEDWDRESVHDALKVKFASHFDEKSSLTAVESTARMSTVRHNKYCEDIRRWAAEFLGIYIPLPNECTPDNGEYDVPF